MQLGFMPHCFVQHSGIFGRSKARAADKVRYCSYGAHGSDIRFMWRLDVFYVNKNQFVSIDAVINTGLSDFFEVTGQDMAGRGGERVGKNSGRTDRT